MKHDETLLVCNYFSNAAISNTLNDIYDNHKTRGLEQDMSYKGI